MPRGRTGRALLWARVRFSRRSLDSVLAAGGDPWSSASLLMRAGQLASPAHRNRVATALDGLVVVAERHPRAPRPRVRAGVVLWQRRRIAALARSLRDPAPLDVAVIARLSLLAREDASPAFAGGCPPEMLDAELGACEAALGGG